MRPVAPPLEMPDEWWRKVRAELKRHLMFECDLPEEWAEIDLGSKPLK